jgi:hypothetical protein
MASSFVATRAQLVFAICLPLAVLVGYFLADPMDRGSIMLLTVVLAVIVTPLLMKWYHPLLICSWNAAVQPYILPGNPPLWLLLAFIGVGFAVLNRFTTPEAKPVDIPSIRNPLVFLLMAVIGTAMLRGGIGLRLLDSESHGGRGYFLLAGAVAGYFALSSIRIPREKAAFWVEMFFLAGLTALIPNMAYAAGPAFEFLFYVFTPIYAIEQAVGGTSLHVQIVRIVGLQVASHALCCFALSRTGFRGMMAPTHAWRFGILLIGLACSLYSGFRSVFILTALLLMIQLCLEGLMKGKGLIIAAVLSALAAMLALPFTDRLPLVVQRSICFLPVEISPVARESGEASSEWRVNMWKEVVPQISENLLLGKGYSINPTDLRFMTEYGTVGFVKSWDWAILTNVYHNGPLSIIMPLGIWGLAGFIWFIWASLRYLVRNYKTGDPELKPVNTLMLSFFLAQLTLFTFVYGDLPTNLFIFTGLIGLSVSINGPEDKPSDTPKSFEDLEEELLGDETRSRE